MKAVILAGGLGTRLKPFTEVIPKPLLPIGEKAVLEHQIEHLKKFGFDEIYIATNYLSDYIEKFLGDGSRYGVKLFYSKEKEALGTAGPLKLLESHLTEPFVIMNGDILSSIDFGRFYDYALHSEAQFTITIKRFITPYAFGNIMFERDFVTGIEEKPDIVTYVLAGIYIMKPSLFSLIPPNTYYGMDLLIKDMLKRKMPIAKYDLHEYWLDIGRVEDYEKAQKEFEANFNSGRNKSN